MNSTYYILDEHGEPTPCTDLIAWSDWFGRASIDHSRIVAQDRDEQDEQRTVLVSTVFLGIDHRFSGTGAPILWETMVLGGVLDGEQQRYSSRAAALLGHQAMCERVKATIVRP